MVRELVMFPDREWLTWVTQSHFWAVGTHPGSCVCVHIFDKSMCECSHTDMYVKLSCLECSQIDQSVHVFPCASTPVYLSCAHASRISPSVGIRT